MESIPLSSAVAEIRRELKIALLSADDQISLEVKDVELELTLEIGRQTNGGGGIAILGVVDAKADNTRSGTQLHRIKLTLHPKLKTSDAGSAPMNLSDSEPYDGDSRLARQLYFVVLQAAYDAHRGR
ncbi:trypco2 family protein [Glycomyces tarimensis]